MSKNEKRTIDEKVYLLALDLTKNFPRSARDSSIAGYVIAGRALDKARAILAGKGGEYHTGCPLDMFWAEFAGVDFEAFTDFIATGATDAEVSEWVSQHAKQSDRIEVVRWNNEWRDKRLSDLPDELQLYMEDYIPENLPRNRPVYHLFDVYDLEEERL